MELKTGKVLFITTIMMILVCVMGVPEHSFAEDEIGNNNVTYSSESSAESLNSQIHDVVETKIDSENTGATKYYSAQVESYFFWLSLRNSEYKKVTGIKASRLEMIQNGELVARANRLDSYSVTGEYRTSNLEFINKLQNVNGENTVDIVLYLGSKEVARVKDYRMYVYENPAISFLNPFQIGVQSTKFAMTVNLLNVDFSQTVDVYLRDEKNNRITKMDKMVEDYYSEEEKTREIEFGLSFNESVQLQEHDSYDVVVEVNGQVVRGSKDNRVIVAEDSYIGSTYYPQMLDLRYRGLGINLLDANPYKIVIEQAGKITKELNGIQAFFNEETYNEEINVELLPEYFAEYGAPYNVKVYNSTNNEMTNFDFLAEKDVINENDSLNPLEGFKTFKKRENIKPTKTWRVTFNKSIDENTIHTGNTYIVENESGKSVKVDYVLQEEGTVLEIIPEKSFTSGATYTLMVDKRVSSGTGSQLKEPAAIEFTVE